MISVRMATKRAHDLAKYERRRQELLRAIRSEKLKVAAVCEAAGMDEREFNNVISGRRKMTDLVTAKVIAGLKHLLA